VLTLQFHSDAHDLDDDDDEMTSLGDVTSQQQQQQQPTGGSYKGFWLRFEGLVDSTRVSPWCRLETASSNRWLHHD